MPPRSSRPLIGLTTYRQTAAWGPTRAEAAFVPAAYVDMVARAGGQPLLVPPLDAGPATDVDALCRVLDGIVLVGGGDVDPGRYRQPVDPRTAGTCIGRDRVEFELLRRGIERGLPVLAICRGLQVLNVAEGGDLVQHLPDRLGSTAHQPEPGRFARVVVTSEPGSHVHRLCGASFEVRCSHHQAIDRLGKGLRVTARSQDGVIEAAELTSRPFVVGVQWHPEVTGDLRLFRGLLAAA